MARQQERQSQSADKSPSLEVGAIPVTLDRIGLRALEYREVPQSTPVEPLPLGARLDVQIDLQVGLNLYPEGIEVYIDLTARPNTKHLPYEVRAAISAFFRRPTDMPDQQLVEFASGAGIRIVFPYIREIVSSTSMRGLFGPLWLDPMAINIVAPQGFTKE